MGKKKKIEKMQNAHRIKGKNFDDKLNNKYRKID